MAKVCLLLRMVNKTHMCLQLLQALHALAHSLHEALGKQGSSLRPILRLQHSHSFDREQGSFSHAGAGPRQ